MCSNYGIVGFSIFTLHCLVSQIKFNAKSGFLNSTLQMFAKMHEKDVLSWTALIMGVVVKDSGRNRKQQVQPLY
jgi:hypothetical protein